MKEARFYKKAEEQKIRCHLCAHRCLIAPSKRGLCNVRENREGTLYSLTYGRAIAKNVDPIEKKPLYHFMPGSLSYSIGVPGCNFRCEWCQNWQISEIDDGADFSTIPESPPEMLARDGVNQGCQSLCFTYTEPTICMEYALDTAKLAHEAGLHTIFVTNGYETPEAVEAMQGHIDAANVDLKTFNDDVYRKQCGATLEGVLKGIKTMFRAGIHLEITTLIVPGMNDNESELKEIADFIASLSDDVVWHVTRFAPAHHMDKASPTPEEKIVKAVEIGKAAGLNYIYPGNIRLPETVHTTCPACHSAVIMRHHPYYPEISLLDKDCCPDCGRTLPIYVK